MILKKKVKVASNLVGGEGKWGLAGIRKVGWGESSADIVLKGAWLKDFWDNRVHNEGLAINSRIYHLVIDKLSPMIYSCSPLV